ncbi:MAG TPA: hypothetical protein VEC19_09925 [Usitatibacter sp.]|nr:hypothetical protein [Usitatibacter sp.]
MARLAAPGCALALVIAGCAAQPPAAVIRDKPENAAQAAERRAKASRPAYNLAGYPPAVREGYIDGCESAKGSQYARKDAKRFSADPQYSMGWNDGFGICGAKR